ncbi:hypothetical protein F2Q69_00043708 [Brassica cretica]|uniref:Uncharacterized protein n=1 Tax=Brassica cretica TaxID=69181 RepID=A0A8S9N6L2_BRACR|nr:hypothetical protein F2Q69_00043708 [Brassica cretica]
MCCHTKEETPQLVTTHPVGVLLKGEVLGSSNVKRTNNLPVDVEEFHPTMEVEIPKSLFEEQRRHFYGARLLEIQASI